MNITAIKKLLTVLENSILVFFLIHCPDLRAHHIQSNVTKVEIRSPLGYISGCWTNFFELKKRGKEKHDVLIIKTLGNNCYRPRKILKPNKLGK